MAKKQQAKEYEHIGTKRIDYFREKQQQKKKFDWDGLFGVIFIVFCVLALVGSCSA